MESAVSESPGNDLRRRLGAGRLIVLDGGMGTEIQARGVPMDGEAWSAIANITHADIVRAIHEDYIRAGADVVIANTFPAGSGALAAAGIEERLVEINQAAVALAQQARERTGEPGVAVAGSLSEMALSGLITPGDDAISAVEAFRVQATALADAGVDLLVLEMMRSETVTESALQAAAETGLPVWLGVSIGGIGPTRAPVTIDGTDVSRLLELAQGRADAVMIMHTDIDVAAKALPILRRAWPGPLGAYPHVGEWTPPNWVFSEISPQAFADKVARWVDDGAQVLGGCCGIGPQHIAALRQALA
ncbi:MAG: homocysteine S-methyltransferase family protein [Actinobacteria bacterium]|nr:MAG: homocysteine S-methyltransferase family protein [Actinomycetota bacterium]